jgi:hypothetical protein
MLNLSCILFLVCCQVSDGDDDGDGVDDDDDVGDNDDQW